MDVCEALADGGEQSLKWALRRAIRAAFEKEARGGRSRGQSGTETAR